MLKCIITLNVSVYRIYFILYFKTLRNIYCNEERVYWSTQTVAGCEQETQTHKHPLFVGSWSFTKLWCGYISALRKYAAGNDRELTALSMWRTSNVTDYKI
jgi:hypothetical protein